MNKLRTGNYFFSHHMCLYS